MKMVKIGPFWGPKRPNMSKFGEIGGIIFSLKDSKNYFNQIYGQKCGQTCHYWRKFGQNRSFLVKMVNFRSFWGPK